MESIEGRRDNRHLETSIHRRQEPPFRNLLFKNKLIKSFRVGSSNNAIKQIKFARKGEFFLVNSFDRYFTSYKLQKTIGNWGFYLGLGQSAVGNLCGIRAIGSWEFSWIWSKRQLGILYYGFLGNRQLGIYLDFEQSAVENLSGFRGKRQLAILSGFRASGIWELYLDFEQLCI